MKLLQQTQSQLIFRSHSPIAAWTSWILGFLISPIALSLLIIRLGVVGLPTTLFCQRTPQLSVSCQLIKHHFPLSWKTAKIPAGELQKARLDKDSGNGQGTYHHRIVLVTRSGEIPMREDYSFGQEYQQKIVDRINNFLADRTQKSVSVRYIEDLPEPLVGFAFDIAWLGAGIFCLRSRHINAKFDRSLNSFTIRQRNAFSNQFFQDSLSEISQIVLTEGELNRKRNYKTYQIFIVMKKGDRLLLARGGNISNKQKEIINNIREYLNIQ
jgi:hypothetical protein